MSDIPNYLIVDDYFEPRPKSMIRKVLMPDYSAILEHEHKWELEGMAGEYWYQCDCGQTKPFGGETSAV